MHDLDALDGYENWEKLPGWNAVYKGLNLYY